jgi:hypothetical protein
MVPETPPHGLTNEQMSQDDRWRVTAYPHGYQAAVKFQSKLNELDIENGLTQGGVSCWGDWVKFESFASLCNKEGVYYQSGSSMHRQPFDVEAWSSSEAPPAKPEGALDA